MFNPHAYNSPVFVIARLCAEPAATPDQLVLIGPLTNTGETGVTRELIPTCPLVLRPHAYKSPADVIARLCDEPAATLVQLPDV